MRGIFLGEIRGNLRGNEGNFLKRNKMDFLRGNQGFLGEMRRFFEGK